MLRRQLVEIGLAVVGVSVIVYGLALLPLGLQPMMSGAVGRAHACQSLVQALTAAALGVALLALRGWLGRRAIAERAGQPAAGLFAVGATLAGAVLLGAWLPGVVAMEAVPIPGWPATPYVAAGPASPPWYEPIMLVHSVAFVGTALALLLAGGWLAGRVWPPADRKGESHDHA